MNLKVSHFYRQLFFVTIILLGLSYLIFLGIFSQKIYSGFLMQLIFLVDILLVHSRSLSSLFSRPDFLLQTSVGLIWLSLVVRSLTAFAKLMYQFSNTNKFIQNLNIVRHSRHYFVISFSPPQAFTAGFLRPHIYLSQTLIDISSPSELSSILLHEQSHLVNHDPLKNLIVDFVSNLTPGFPFKSWFFGQYQTLIEISCDSYSQNHNQHPTSLVSALMKIQEFNYPRLASAFSAQSERIKILVGQKTQNLRSFFIFNLSLVSLLFVFSLSLSHSNLFYSCDHLFKCFTNLFTPDHVLPQPSVNRHDCQFSRSSS